jgi:hypothetical protein
VGSDHSPYLRHCLWYAVPMAFQPMPLSRRPAPFDHPEWVFELKYDGFRSLAVIENGRCQLNSRSGPSPASENLVLGGELPTAGPVKPAGQSPARFRPERFSLALLGGSLRCILEALRLRSTIASAAMKPARVTNVLAVLLLLTP